MIAFSAGLHNDSCDTQWNEKPCDCGIIELSEALESNMIKTVVIDGEEYEVTETELSRGASGRGIGVISFVDRSAQECSPPPRPFFGDRTSHLAWD